MSPLTRIALPAPDRLTADVIVIGLCEGDRVEESALPPAIAKAIAAELRRTKWKAQRDRVHHLTIEHGGRRVAVLGGGPAQDFDRKRFSGWLGKALQLGQEQRAGRLAIVLPDHDETRSAAAAFRILVRLALSGYRYEAYKGQDDGHPPRAVQLLPPRRAAEVYRAERKAAAAAAEGTVLARDLGNTPPNVATPDWLATRARAVAGDAAMKATVFGMAQLRKMGMGGLIAVGAGSSHAPRLVRLEWGRRGPIVALVGKGVTFDTGGISIKPAADMDEMKYDKCGACNVLGAALAAARLALPIRLRCYLPLAENMPSGSAYRPGDIVRCYNHKTVEITNTDAEGRLILADAMALAIEEHPDYLLEMSTLTGAAVVALGERAAALYCSEDGMAQALLGSADDSGERLWRMPLWPEYVEEMKGNHADLKNSAGRWGGACNAAAFLSQFVDGHPRWAHLDIAGPAVSARPRQATGYGVALTLRWLQTLTEGGGAEPAPSAAPNGKRV
jgi:leucyl aminopeptidase